MADTFKGIITADGKKRQLPYNAVFGTPASDPTLSLEGAFADSKAVGDKFKETKAETDSLKEDIDNYYPKKQGAFKCVNMVSNLPDEVIMPSGIEKNILDGVCAINGTSTIDYPNLIIKKNYISKPCIFVLCKDERE